VYLPGRTNRLSLIHSEPRRHRKRTLAIWTLGKALTNFEGPSDLAPKGAY